MTETIYRFNCNGNTIEHKVTLTENNLNRIIPAIITILQAEWQEEAIEQAFSEYLK